MEGTMEDKPPSVSRRCVAKQGGETRARWGNFAWTKDHAARAQELISHYPEGRQASAVMGLLDLAQRQVGADTNTQG